MRTQNIVIAGLGGQGVVKASDILADAVFRAGYDVKKAEVHGMSQRGGAVNTDVRFGNEVLSPMVPDGEADVILVMDASQLPAARRRLAPGGAILDSSALGEFQHGGQRSGTVAMLGVMSAGLDLPAEIWHDAIRANLSAKLHAENLAAFDAGRAWALSRQAGE